MASHCGRKVRTIDLCFDHVENNLAIVRGQYDAPTYLSLTSKHYV